MSAFRFYFKIDFKAYSGFAPFVKNGNVYNQAYCKIKSDQNNGLLILKQQ